MVEVLKSAWISESSCVSSHCCVGEWFRLCGMGRSNFSGLWMGVGLVRRKVVPGGRGLAVAVTRRMHGGSAGIGVDHAFNTTVG